MTYCKDILSVNSKLSYESINLDNFYFYSGKMFIRLSQLCTHSVSVALPHDTETWLLSQVIRLQSSAIFCKWMFHATTIYNYTELPNSFVAGLE